MAQFEPIRAELEQAKAQLMFVAAEKREGMFKPAKFLQKHPVAFPFLLDEDRAVTKAYGLYHRLGKDAINIAHPATLVIDSSGTVRYIYRGDDQTDRAPIEKILEAVRKLPIGLGPKANT
jgi:peroxiredoxin